MTTLLNALALLAWYAGHCELWTAGLNQVYARPWSRRRLTRWRFWHDWSLILFPLLLVGVVGLWRPGVLVGGDWNDLDWPGRVYLVPCAVGLTSLVLNSAWRTIRPRPAAVRKEESRVIDVAAELGERPIGNGRHQGMARLWFNETFQLELLTRTVHLPGLPESCAGLSLVQFSDLHFTGTVDRRYFDRVIDLAIEMQPDLVVCTGDLLDNMDLLDWLPETLGRIDAPLGRFFILGNHDWHLRPEEIRQAMQACGWRDIAGRCESFEHRGATVEIGGTEQPWLGGPPQFASHEETRLRLLLSHTPDNLGWARDNAVDLMLAGHNHGGQVCLPLIGPVYSPSRYGCRFAAGTFFCNPTLLVVTRGLSGRHPLRWLCRPELTRIVFDT